MNNDLEEKIAAIYELHQGLFPDDEFACHRGCATCCTSSVTACEAEAGIAAAFMAGKGIPLIGAEMIAAGRQLSLSTNAYAAACLAGETVEEEEEHDLSPCPLLFHGKCLIYPARPFVCRAFVSTADCAVSGAADIPPWLVSLNTVIQQVIEHLCQGQRWGNFLSLLTMAENHPDRQCRGIPALLVPPWEIEILRPYIRQLMSVLDDEPGLSRLFAQTFGI